MIFRKFETMKAKRIERTGLQPLEIESLFQQFYNRTILTAYRQLADCLLF